MALEKTQKTSFSEQLTTPVGSSGSSSGGREWARHFPHINVFNPPHDTVPISQMKVLRQNEVK